MKKLLSLIAVIALVTVTCIMGVGTVASAAPVSSADDFLVYDGVLEEYIGNGGDVVIPDTLGIKEIAERAFANNESITSVVIPEGVEKIGGFAFNNCVNIEQLTLPYSLYELDQHCFSGLASLTDLVIPGNCEIVSYGAFSGCVNLTSLVLSYGVKEIHVLAFQATGIGRVIFPETVELICGNTFSNNKNPYLTTIEYYICNPDCEIGWEVEGAEKCAKHQWARQISPWNDNVGDPIYKIYVPEDSAVYNFLNEKGSDMLHEFGSGAGDTQRLIAKDKSFFADAEALPENQKGYGTQKPGSADNDNQTSGTDNTQSPTNGSLTNNTNSNKQNTTDITYSDSESAFSKTLIIVICIFGGIMLIAIVAVVILAATGKLFGGKKAEKADVAPEDPETAALKAEIAAAKREKEIAALKAELAEIRGENSNSENK